MIASTREAVSKVMSELQRDGVIESRNRRIIIVNGRPSPSTPPGSPA